MIGFGDSVAAQVGDPVIAFGSPLALDRTVTSGIVSALNRPVVTGTSGASESYVDAIQTDAAINPGNSGGPLTDGAGNMIGINAAIASTASASGQAGSIGLGFAIPYNEAKRIFAEIIAKGFSTRPVLGVAFDNTYTGKGAKISQLTTGAGSDAATKAGIPVGMVITSINGIRIANYTAAIVRIRSFAPGEIITVVGNLNGGTSKSYTVTLGSAVSN